MSDPAPESSKDPFQLCGSTIEDKYRVASVIGDGGFGVVYRGVHKGFGELIAIKCLKMPRALDDKQREGFLEQLREEGRLLHRLSKATSSIVQALDVGAFTAPNGDWVPYLVLEWLEGETLGEHLRNRADRGEPPYTLAEAIKFMEPAARALAVAHKHKIAHRDVKPPNLFVIQTGGQQTIKVLDFGIAKVLTETPSLTEALAKTNLAGPSAFTPRYGAPEQFNKQRGASGPWTDVFALALILVEVMTGKKALEGDDPTQLYIAAADPTTRPTPRVRGAVVPDAVEQVLEKALSVEPKYRYPDAGEFWDALVAAASLGGPATTGARSPMGITSLPGSEAQISAMMGTGDFASHVKLDVQVEKSSAKPSLSMQQTMPAESIVAPSKQPVVLVHEAAPAPSAKGAKQGPRDDSMAETPAAARQPVSALAAPETKATPVAPQAAQAAPAPEKQGRSVWPWVAGLMLIGGVTAGAVVMLQSDDSNKKLSGASGRKGTAGSASARKGAGPTPPVSAALPRASASAEAVVAPPAPPPDMALIPAASLKMGAGDTQRDVTISRPFYIDRAEVTVRDYEQCVTQRMCSAAEHVALTAESAAPNAALTAFEEASSKLCNAHPSRKMLDHPMNCVDFSQAETFCKWRGRRLPTEAEWELAARGAAGRVYPWGADAPACDRACYDKDKTGSCKGAPSDAGTCPSQSRKGDRTPEGVLDLGGNVSEWVSDGWSATPQGGVDPKGDPNALVRVVRGGSFVDPGDRLNATWRDLKAPVTAFVTIGFRCAMDGPAPSGP